MLGFLSLILIGNLILCLFSIFLLLLSKNKYIVTLSDLIYWGIFYL